MAAAASIKVVAGAKRRCWRENRLAVASSSAAKYPARLRLKMSVMFPFGSRSESGHESGGPLGDDGLAARQLGLAMPHVFTHDGFEVVDVVEKDIGDLLHIWGNVAGNGDFDE